jgi:hypothetical protein
VRYDPSVAGVAVRLGDDLLNLMAASPIDCSDFAYLED